MRIRRDIAVKYFCGPRVRHWIFCDLQNSIRIVFSGWRRKGIAWCLTTARYYLSPAPPPLLDATYEREFPATYWGAVVMRRYPDKALNDSYTDYLGFS